MDNIKLFSFFSGAGFLDLGFEKAGFNTVFVNEIHSPFLDTYIYSRKKIGIQNPVFGYSNLSIEEYLEGKNKSQLGELVKKCKIQNNIVGFIAGPPCPDFSIGGKNRGHTGDHGRLTEVYFNLVNELRPDFFLFENVKGLWKTKRHREFYNGMVNFIQSNGYIITEKLINSLEYGAPQNRERIILLGFTKRLLEETLDFTIGTNSLPLEIFPWKKYSYFSIDEINQIKWPEREPFVENSNRPKPDNIPRKLTVQNWFDKNNVENHPNSIHYFKPRAGLSRFQTIDEGDDSKKSYKRLHRWRYSSTVAYGNNEVHLHPYKARRLTVSEALSLQSLPEEFEIPENITLSNMFKTVGNGVPYLAALSIAKSLADFLEGIECQ